MRDGGELGSGHAMVDRADSNAAEKCCGSLAKHYNIYVSLKPICVTHVLCTFFTKVRILYFDSQERCEGRGWLCGPVLQLAGWRPGPSRKLLRNISVMKRRAAAGGGTGLVCCRCCFYPHHNFHCSLSLSTRAGNEHPRRFHNHGEGPYRD